LPFKARDLREFWNKTAKEFGRNGYSAVLFPSSRGVLNWYTDWLQRNALKKIFGELKGKRILDVGCGVGRWSIQLAAVAEHVVGVDFARGMVGIAKDRAIERAPGNVDFVLASAHSLPFSSRSFDASLSVTVLQHIVDEKQLVEALSEIARIAKIGGRIILLEQTPCRREAAHSQFPTVGRTHEEWVHLFTSKGSVELVDFHGVDLSPFLRPLMQLMRKHGRYQNWLSQETPSLRYRILSRLFYYLISLAVIMSLPFDLALRDILVRHSKHKLLIFRRRADKDAR
jgi:ubiquinone/menaquinone biosynthesis C-methylase UbiE